MKKYICNVCGYIYDPAAGDPDSGVAPGTAFEDIPEDWVCPVCGLSKDAFAVRCGQGGFLSRGGLSRPEMEKAALRICGAAFFVS